MSSDNNLTKEEKAILESLKRAGVSVSDTKNTDPNRKMLVKHNGEIYEFTKDMILISQSNGKKYRSNFFNLNEDIKLTEIKEAKGQVAKNITNSVKQNSDYTKKQ